MGMLSRIQRSRLERRTIENPSTPLSAPDDWLYGALGAVRSSAGINVNRETALTYAAFWRGVNLISGDIAKLPIHIFKLKGQSKEKDKKHPGYSFLRRKPNITMKAFDWKKVMTIHAIMLGNGYSYIFRDGGARPTDIVPLFPDRTYPLRENGKLWYVTEVMDEEGKLELRKCKPEDVIHLKGLGYDGIQGYSVISKARESLGLGMAGDKYGSIYFRNQGRPDIVLRHPARISKQAQENLKETWEKTHTGLDQAHRVALLQEGMDLTVLDRTSAKNAQLLELRGFQRTEIALWLGVPPHKLGDSSRTSYNSLEQENQDYLDSGLSHWIVQWEDELWDKLLTEDEKDNESHEILFDVGKLVRANLQARADYYVKALHNGWMNRDEVREEEGRNPMPEGAGEEFFLPTDVRLESDPAPGTETTPPGAGGGSPPAKGVPALPDPTAPGAGVDNPQGMGRAELPTVEPRANDILTSMVGSDRHNYRPVADDAAQRCTNCQHGEFTDGKTGVCRMFREEGLDQNIMTGHTCDEWEAHHTTSNTINPVPPVEVKAAKPAPEPSRTFDVDSLQSAHDKLFISASNRVVRRLTLHARRASKSPSRFMEWLDTLVEEHQRSVQEIIREPYEAARILNPEVKRTAEEVAAEAILGMRGALLEVSGDCVAGELERRVNEYCSHIEILAPLKMLEGAFGERSHGEKPTRSTEEALVLLDNLPEIDTKKETDHKDDIAVLMPVNLKPPFLPKGREAGIPDDVLEYLEKNSEEDVMRIAQLIATQEFVDRPRVKEFIKAPDRYKPRSKDLKKMKRDMPHAVECEDGNIYLFDGHHRTMGNQLLGVAKMPMYYCKWKG